ncbi:MAG: TRAM domain-containing protein [Armatimonadota bacterium]|nr:TRAM domain-containing protein [bacterium]
MAVSGRRIRPLFTLAFVVLGAVMGNALAQQTLSRLDAYLKGINTEAPKFLSLIPINPVALSSGEKWRLIAVFVVAGALLGFAIERIAFLQAQRTKIKWEGMAPQEKVGAVAGLILGLLLTLLLRSILSTPWWVNIITAVLLCYMSVVALESLMEQVRFYFPGSMPASKGHINLNSRPKILDTNVIIDGRIADIARAGFIEGPVYIPKFVLEELQQIADSSDSLKRARGRRGLDILNQMQKEMELRIPEFTSVDPNDEVDSRLVVAAREVHGAIVTNDYNLNRVAELQGVDVLNINELANALKPVVLPGEEMRVTIIREGKEKDQGIGYLDDGTMIVVEGGRRLIGETLDVAVTSVLQTVQGKMIFGKSKENGDFGSDTSDESIRSYTGGRPRRKIR